MAEIPDRPHASFGLLSLLDVEATDRAAVGSKASVLARLAQAGFDVPEGYVVPAALLDSGRRPSSGGTARLPAALEWLAHRFENELVAVRSSAVAEDTTAASYAGVFDTYLDVPHREIPTAIGRCFDAASAPRVRSYQRRLGIEWPVEMSVLVQRMVPADVAGVAFGVDPMTGDPDRALVTVTRGLGEGVVDGRVVEEWVVTKRTAQCRLSQGIFSADSVHEVQRLAARVGDEMGSAHVDLEWARTADRLVVLQARPITARLATASWQVPYGGMWLRTIRLGEWLPEPVTPLFDSWALPALEDGFRRRQRQDAGFLAPPPLHVLVNGWYFHSPVGTGDSRLMISGFVRRPRFAAGFTLASTRPDLADKLAYGRLRIEALGVLEPRYRAQVDVATDVIETASPAELIRTVDAVLTTAAEVLWALVMIGGAAWRAESALRRFVERRIGVDAAAQTAVLLADASPTQLGAHAIFSLDWMRPTLSEVEPRTGASAGAQVLAAAQREMQSRCQEALSRDVRAQRRFQGLVDVARRHARSRDLLSAALTYGWPLMRRAVSALGEELKQRGVLGDAEQVFYLTRGEVESAVASRRHNDLGGTASQRRELWEAQRRLAPPLSIGAPSYFVQTLLPSTRQRSGEVPDGAIVGVPASPGTATGRVRLLDDPTRISDVQNGDVLVVVATPPAITACFSRIAAVCVDGGSVAAHASIVAREFGLPAVIGLANATRRLVEGQWVVVNGTVGYVHATGVGGIGVEEEP